MKNWVILLFFFTLPVQAHEYFGIGGGYNPYRSEASLEQSFMRFQSLVGGSPMTSYYGGGADKEICDTIEKDPQLPTFSKLYFKFFNVPKKSYYECRLRHNRIALLTGPAHKEEIVSGLENLAIKRSKEANHTPLRIYFTGHGSEGSTFSDDELDELGSSDRRKFNLNRLNTFDGEQINVKEWTTILDQFPEQTPIQIMMVQCYAGGFAQMNFKGGDTWNRISDAKRCGFFAQIPSKTSAGCTPDSFDNKYYSNYFFEAYEKARVGAMDADYNHDGIIGANEAHAYVKIHSDTDDMPVATSDELLREIYNVIPKIKKSRKYRQIGWPEIEKRLAPEEAAVIHALNKNLKINLNRFEHGLIEGIDQRLDASQSSQGWDLGSHLILTRDELNSMYQEKEKTFSDSLKKLQLYYMQRYPYAFLDSSKIKDEKLKTQAIEQNRIVANTFETDPNRAKLQKELDEMEKANELADQFNKINAQAKRLYLLIQAKAIEIVIESLWKEDSVAISKLKQLKACESEPYFELTTSNN